jgi:hypothetical protein
MVWTKRWRKRMRALMRRDDVERELDEELAFHLQMETEKNLRAGMSPAEARRRVEGHKEEVRDARWLGGFHGLSLDARLAAQRVHRRGAIDRARVRRCAAVRGPYVIGCGRCACGGLPTNRSR